MTTQEQESYGIVPTIQNDILSLELTHIYVVPVYDLH